MRRTSMASPLPSCCRSAEPLHLCISAGWFAVYQPCSVSAARPNAGFRGEVVVVDGSVGNDIVAPVGAVGRRDEGSFGGYSVGDPI